LQHGLWRGRYFRKIEKEGKSSKLSYCEMFTRIENPSSIRSCEGSIPEGIIEDLVVIAALGDEEFKYEHG